MIKRHPNLFIKILLIVVLLLLFWIIFSCINGDVLAKETKISTPILYPELTYTTYYDPEITEEYLAKIRGSIAELENIDTCNYTRKAFRAMCRELVRLEELEARVASDLEHYKTWEEEYYYATKVWEYFRQRGFSQEVTCAIIGNMMIETSGGTLALNPTIYSPSGNYYGLCQWSQKYCPDTKDLPFEYQLDYLLGSMQWEFNTFGKNYKVGFDYEDFLKMRDVKAAALAFAKSYERCGPASYEMRQEAAEKAYNYFNLDH